MCGALSGTISGFKSLVHAEGMGCYGSPLNSLQLRGGLVTDNSNEEVPDGQVRYYLSLCTVHIYCCNIVSLFN